MAVSTVLSTAVRMGILDDDEEILLDLAVTYKRSNTATEAYIMFDDGYDFC